MNKNLKDNELVAVATVKDAHSLKGELFILPFANDLSWLDQLTHFWIQTKKFTIEETRPHKKGFIVKTSEIKDRTEADKYKGSEFQIPSELLVSKKGETIFLYEIEGFEVNSKEHGTIGTIKSFSSNGAQDLLVVSDGKREIQIPFIEEFIVKIDWKNKQVTMKLPEGLLEI